MVHMHGGGGHFGGHWAAHLGGRHFGHYGRQWGRHRFFRGGQGSQFPDPQVQSAQACLAQVVDPSVPQDGIMGPQTRQAIRQFQMQQQMPPTGMLDPDTMSALQNACSPQQAAPPPPPPPPPPPQVQVSAPPQGGKHSQGQAQEAFLGDLLNPLGPIGGLVEDFSAAADRSRSNRLRLHRSRMMGVVESRGAGDAAGSGVGTTKPRMSFLSTDRSSIFAGAIDSRTIGAGITTGVRGGTMIGREKCGATGLPLQPERCDLRLWARLRDVPWPIVRPSIDRWSIVRSPIVRSSIDRWLTGPS